ncbi:MAG: hypothetical protein V1692_00130, partial [bacterium]
MLTLDTPIIELPTVGKATVGRLKRLKLETAEDLIFYYPFRYDDLGKIVKIADLDADQTAVIKAKVDLIENRRSRKRRKMFITEALVSDGQDSLKVIWFNQPFLKKTIKAGSIYYLAGRVDYDRFGLQMINPTYELLKDEQTHTARLVPNYPLTTGLTQKQLRFLIKSCLPLVKKLNDFLPKELLTRLKLPSLPWALAQVHFPKHQRNLDKAIERLKFNELFLIQLNSQII